MTAPQSKQGPLFTHPLAFAILLFPFFLTGSTYNTVVCSHIVIHQLPIYFILSQEATLTETAPVASPCGVTVCYYHRHRFQGGVQGIEMFKKHYKGEKVQQHYSEINASYIVQSLFFSNGSKHATPSTSRWLLSITGCLLEASLFPNNHNPTWTKCNHSGQIGK